MKLTERIASFILILAMSILLCSCGVKESNEAPPTPLPTENAAVVEDISLMFYTTQIESEFSLMVGEMVELWTDVACSDAEAPEVTWTSSNEDGLALSFEEGKKEVSAIALSAEENPVMLTLSCGEVEKNYTVHIRSEAGEVSIPGPGELKVKDIKLMYFNTELDEFTITLGESVWLNAEVIFEGNLTEQPVWTSSNEACLTIDYDPEAAYAAKVTALSVEESPVTLTLSCAGVEKDFTVYLHPGM